ncbi:uncharacterized protein EDB91DRAFT_1152948 [Suillus paluster]|uniref:uncharacterized protein n=1 Tax=Suillus paluster TaxID=48578 RepID=UPI001B8775A7|nr:uncharacterized protein EDB91DRAFT_1152948 [Suillus paluster]KAG1732016.1 hypothetical protein EDB91DRAFT_1152948 [Suillus paluster]
MTIVPGPPVGATQPDVKATHPPENEDMTVVPDPPVVSTQPAVEDMTVVPGPPVSAMQLAVEVTHPPEDEDMLVVPDPPVGAQQPVGSQDHYDPLHPRPGVSTMGPLNVLLFGGTGVGKSSIIRLINEKNPADTLPDAAHSRLKHANDVNLGGCHFKLWEISSIASMCFCRRLIAKWKLKRSYKKLHRDGGVHLLLYCMRGTTPQSALVRDYQLFTDIVGSTAGPGGVPVASVVTGLEGYPNDMDNWWMENKADLERLGMQFSAQACITSLPDDPNASPSIRARRKQSEQVIRNLMYDSESKRGSSNRASTS